MDDPTFREFCLTYFDADLDGKVSRAEANAGTQIGMQYIVGLQSIKGIGYFSNLNDISFQECHHLKSADLSNNLKLKVIQNKAFASCTNMKSLRLPGSVTSIGESAFSFCEALTEIHIPPSVVSIGAAPLAGCTRLATIHGKYASADNRCLICDGRLMAFAPAGLTEYTLPNDTKAIAAMAFAECTELIGVHIPDHVTSIEAFAFLGCHNLKEIDIPQETNTIQGYAFQHCLNLTHITIPEKVTSIGSCAFYYCNRLADIYFKPTVPPSIGTDPFDDLCLPVTIHVPAASVEAYKTAPGWSRYTTQIVGDL